MATTAPSTTDSTDLQDLIGPIWRRKWLLLAIIVMSTVGTYVAASRQPDRFRASTQFIVASSPVEAIVKGAQAGTNDRSTLDQAKLLLSRSVTDRVVKRLGSSALSSKVTAEPVFGSSFVSVTAEGGSSAQAAALANAYVQEYFGFRNEQFSKEAADAIARIRAQLNSIARTRSNELTRQTLEGTIRQLESTESTSPRQAQQTNPAVTGQRFAPTPRRDAVFALTIALGLSLALAFALERFDRRIRHVDELAKLYGAPLLSAIPHESAPTADHDGKAAVPESLREPFRSLRTNLQFASLDKPIQRIAVTSAVAREGKSTVVRNLALTYREWGLSVVVIEADLRRPTLAAAFGTEAGTGGLTSVLTGECDLDDALLEIQFDIASLDYLARVRVGTEPRAHATAKASSASASRLMLLPSGDMPPNPQAVLAADRTRLVIQQLSERFDIMLIDTPPLLAVSDAIPLLAQADGVVMVARIGVTQRPAAQRAAVAARLDPSVRILGVVANDIAFQPGSDYGYAYGYGYGYDSRSNGKKT